MKISPPFLTALGQHSPVYMQWYHFCRKHVSRTKVRWDEFLSWRDISPSVSTLQNFTLKFPHPTIPLKVSTFEVPASLKHKWGLGLGLRGNCLGGESRVFLAPTLVSVVWSTALADSPTAVSGESTAVPVTLGDAGCGLSSARAPRGRQIWLYCYLAIATCSTG